MITNKNIERICLVIIALTLSVTVLFMFGEKIGIKPIFLIKKKKYYFLFFLIFSILSLLTIFK